MAPALHRFNPSIILVPPPPPLCHSPANSAAAAGGASPTESITDHKKGMILGVSQANCSSFVVVYDWQQF